MQSEACTMNSTNRQAEGEMAFRVWRAMNGMQDGMQDGMQVPDFADRDVVRGSCLFERVPTLW